MQNLILRLKAMGLREEGQSIIELAVMTPLLLALMAGAVDIGVFTYESIEVGNAARAGVQYGSQSASTAGDTTGITNAAKNDAKQITGLTVTPSSYCACDSAKLTVVTCPTTGASPCASSDHLDYFVKVIASDTFTPVMKFPKPSITVTRTAIQQYTQ